MKKKTNPKSEIDHAKQQHQNRKLHTKGRP